MSETSFQGTPYRVLSAGVDAPDGRYVTQVVADRTAEVRTLQVLLVVLIGGGALALLAALGLGRVYAERALVPIRDSLRRQREFAADASHELRTPLAVLRSSAEHLRRHRAEPVGQVGTAVTDIELEVERMTALVDDLLLLARTDSGTVELSRAPVDLADLATDATGRLAGVADDAGVRLLLDAEPVVVDGDRARLEQLLGILLANAVRHSPRGTEVTVAVGRDGRDARLSVLDRGRGIEPSHLPRVFDRFWRAPDAPEGGTGLGLAIAALDRRNAMAAAWKPPTAPTAAPASRYGCPRSESRPRGRAFMNPSGTSRDMSVRRRAASSNDDPPAQESRMTTLATRRAAAPLIGGLLTLLIAACSQAAAAPSGVATLQSPDAAASGDPEASPSASLSPEDAALAFARCMREHGIPMDDPQVGGGANGPISISIGGPGIDREKLQAAQEACGGFMGVSGPKGTMSAGPARQAGRVRLVHA